MSQTESQARTIGGKVVALLGSDWKYRVWNNLGWHVSWINGAVSLHYNPETMEFWSMIGPVGSGVGIPELSPRACTHSHSHSPFIVIQKAIEFAQKENLEREATMASCSEVIMGLLKQKMEE